MQWNQVEYWECEQEKQKFLKNCKDPLVPGTQKFWLLNHKMKGDHLHCYKFKCIAHSKEQPYGFEDCETWYKKTVDAVDLDSDDWEDPYDDSFEGKEKNEDGRQ